MSRFQQQLKQLFTLNLGLKAISLIAAIVVYSLIRGSEDAQRSVFVDVVAILPAATDAPMLVSELPDRVRVTFKGSRTRLNAIRPEAIPAVEIDLSDSDARYYYFTDDEFEVLPGLQITQVAPPTIELRWAERVARTLPVQAQLINNPAEGLMLAEPPTMVPTEVELIGPADEVRGLRLVRTEAIDLSRLGEGELTRRVPLESLPAHVRTSSNRPIEVHIALVPDLTDQIFDGIALSLLPEGVHASAEHEVISVTLRGPSHQVSLLDPASLRATIDLSGVRAGTDEFMPTIVGVPDGIEVITVNPPAVIVHLEQSPD